jgi:hypothetical protein
MTKLLATFLLAMVAATPAVAQHRHMIAPQYGYEALQDYAPGGFSPPAADSYAVIVGNRIVGRDPDPNVRLSLTRDPYVDGE